MHQMWMPIEPPWMPIEPPGMPIGGSHYYQEMSNANNGTKAASYRRYTHHRDLPGILPGIYPQRTALQRVFSFKGLHGMLMFTSWLNVAGRMFATPRREFTCHTHPFYKMAHLNSSAQVPLEDAAYDRLPWASPGGR